jgi:hypothetical protein
MKKGKTVTLYIANSNCSTSMDAYREQQAVEEVEGQEQPSHWELWIGRVQGCADPAAVLPSPGFVMKGFPFVEIAGCRQEDVVEFYEGHFAKVHEHGSPRKALRRLRGYVRKRRPGGLSPNLLVTFIDPHTNIWNRHYSPLNRFLIYFELRF